MKRRLLVLPLLVFAFLWVAGAGPQARSAAAAKLHVDPCGTGVNSQIFAEPPDVDVAELPLNASGEHELILAARGDGHRFCYAYTTGGVMHIAAPTIRVARGQHFALRLVNELAGKSRGATAASTAIPGCMPMAMRQMRMPAAPVLHYVGYMNHVIDDRFMKVRPIDTNIHLHGFEGPADQENVFLSTLSTPMHACEYHITIPRSQPPGVYFYHPHVHGASDDQVALGLSGAWIVEPDGRPSLPRSAEHVILLRYRLPIVEDNRFVPDGDPFFIDGAAHEGALRPALAAAYDPFDPPPWPESFPTNAGGMSAGTNACDGVGSQPLLSVDGADAPASLDVPGGEAQLLHIVNATSDSPKALELRDRDGRVQPLRVAALDGMPVSGDAAHPYARYVSMNRLLLSPSSRASIMVTVDRGSTLTLASGHFCEGRDAFYQLHHDLLKIVGVAAGEAHVPAVAFLPSPGHTPAMQLVAYARAHASSIRRRAIAFTEYGFPKSRKIPLRSAFYITDITDRKFREHPYWPAYRMNEAVPMHADITVKQGAIEEWYLINTTMEAHAFHIHQMSFVEEKSGAGVPMAVDVAFVPVGTLLANRRDPNYALVRPAITKVLLDFRHVPRGTFLFHCHMLFHEDHGMMGVIRVE